VGSYKRPRVGGDRRKKESGRLSTGGKVYDGDSRQNGGGEERKGDLAGTKGLGENAKVNEDRKMLAPRLTQRGLEMLKRDM